MATRIAWLPELHSLTCLQHMTQLTIGSFNTTRDSALCRVIQNMLLSRRFYVEPNNERSRWKKQKNGFPHIYTNDQIYPGTRSFIYADNLCITAQYPSFTEVEFTIEDALWSKSHNTTDLTVCERTQMRLKLPHIPSTEERDKKS